jgi:hypothetical protein
MRTSTHPRGTRAGLWLLAAAAIVGVVRLAIVVAAEVDTTLDRSPPPTRQPDPVVIVTLPPPACEAPIDVAGIRLPCEATVDARDDGATTVIVAKMPTAGWTDTRQMLTEDDWTAAGGGTQRWSRDGDTLAAVIGTDPEDDQVEVTLTITRTAPPRLPPELAEQCTNPPPDQQAGCDLLELLYDSVDAED